MTNQRIINFLRYLNKEDKGILAIKLINGELDKGVDLDLILKKDAKGFGYSLRAIKISEDRYKIEFGCQSGPLAGDGGEWEVIFDGSDNVIECGIVETWES